MPVTTPPVTDTTIPYVRSYVSGDLARLYLNSAARQWTASSYGTAYSPNNSFNIADETAGSVRFRIDTDGSVTSFISLKTPILYDSDDTTYYVNPNGASKLVSLGLGGGAANPSSLYIKALSGVSDGHVEIHKYYGTSAASTESLDWPTPILALRTFQDYDRDTMMSFGVSNDAVYKTDDSVWNFRLRGITNVRTSSASTHFDIGGPGILSLNASYTTHTGSARAPIFYDTDDTNYYCDPNSWSRMANINANVYQSQDNWWLDAAGNQRMLWVSADHSYYKTNNYHVFRKMDNTDLHYIASDGNVWMGTYKDWLSTQIRSAIFYDHNDTGYYCDPNGNSHFNTLNLYGNELILQGGSPTMSFNDTDQQCAVLHNNSNLFYILRRNSYTVGWTTVGSGWWPMSVDLTNNNVSWGGDINAAYNIIAYASDKRLKENIVEIPNAIDKIKKIRGVTFDWNEKADELGFKPKTKYNDLGVIAQEIQAVLPQAVAPAPFDKWQPDPDKNYSDEYLDEKRDTSRSGEDYLTVQLEKIIPLLIEGIKEQQRQIDSLMARLG